MPRTVRVERVSTREGEFDARVVLPESGSGPGIVVLQEIFGVGEYIKEAADRLAGLGYVALGPDLYWRIAPGITLGHDEAGLGAFEVSQQLDHSLAIRDSVDALAALRALPEVADTGGKAGVLGFCLGGMLSFGGRDRGRSGRRGLLPRVGDRRHAGPRRAHRLSGPVPFRRRGGRVGFPFPREQVDAVCAFADSHAGMECHVQPDAGHAFDNHEAPMFHQPEPAARAWEITREFLARTLPA